MKQITVKSAVEAWRWIANNAHHEVGTEFTDSGERKAIYLRNHVVRLRVPDALCPEVFKGLKPNERPFDTRMYALTNEAREVIEPAWKPHPHHFLGLSGDDCPACKEGE